jgi:arabinan endo-1,5-alpha-L-arabinosidase
MYYPEPFSAVSLRAVAGRLIGAASLLVAAAASSFGLALSGSYSAHDPSRIVECNGKYYVYFTGPLCPMHYSSDLVHWSDGKQALDSIPDWARKLVPNAQRGWIWAPDVIKVGKLYYLFYSYSTFGSKVSAIGLEVGPALDPSDPAYHWKDMGLVVSSNEKSDYNAIDPCPIVDTRGDLWMTYGSWNKGGIQIVKLDKQTGKPISKRYYLASGQTAGPEASFLYYEKGYYYLFDNEGTCCQGTKSTYHVMMGRSKSITGPYLDKSGRDMRTGGGSLFMARHGDQYGPGQIGISNVKGTLWVAFHYYDATKNGWPEMGIEDVKWGRDGWPMSPWQPARTIADGAYAIISKSTGLAISLPDGNVGDGAALVQSPFGAKPTQVWRVESTEDGYYRIVSAATDKAVDLWQCNTADGTKIDQFPWFDNACQRWNIEKVTDGGYRIVSMGGRGAITGDAANSVVENAYHGDPSQQWTFKPLPTAGIGQVKRSASRLN